MQVSPTTDVPTNLQLSVLRVENAREKTDGYPAVSGSARGTQGVPHVSAHRTTRALRNAPYHDVTSEFHRTRPGAVHGNDHFRRSCRFRRPQT